MLISLALAAAVSIPNGFLLYEKAASIKDDDPETSWSVSGKKTAPLVVDPCERPKLGQSGRTAAKTIVYTAVPDYSKSEQVVLYASEAAARRALSDLRAAATACRTGGYRYAVAPLALGDEAVTVSGQSYQGGKPAIGGERAVVVRRADALVLYTRAGEWGRPAKADYREQIKDARRMLAKLCTVARCEMSRS
ncbi:hypothetical protein GCM10010149_78460 [Nonomuraea roseoviolacea subsp. roseoviolacea]|uniref:Sensor domain-containing protein n=1 Tax=Nonomuraea roseoviolacea subsp. carminata TaxID=160689 RepID=A0ABT1KA77_9ACTN|nr:hypothetical protein [Nonomuraea roseoviolacea]MCP2350497.1 hypothetical protein [Nonomuraea roseoviolacea subsp. carminata]